MAYSRPANEEIWGTCKFCGCAFKTMFYDRDYCDDALCIEAKDQELEEEGAY